MAGMMPLVAACVGRSLNQRPLVHLRLAKPPSRSSALAQPWRLAITLAPLLPVVNLSPEVGHEALRRVGHTVSPPRYQPRLARNRDSGRPGPAPTGHRRHEGHSPAEAPLRGSDEAD